MSPFPSRSRFAGEILTCSDSHVSGSVKAGKYTLPDFTVVRETGTRLEFDVLSAEGTHLIRYPFRSVPRCSGYFSRVPRSVLRPISRWELDHEKIDDCTGHTGMNTSHFDAQFFARSCSSTGIV